MHKRGIASPLVGRAAFVPPKQDFTETVFNQFVKAETLRGSLSYFFTICEQTGLKQFENHDTFYNSLKEKVKFWRANSLWSLLTPLKEREEYKNGAICAGQKVLVIGAGPCGLRTAIECAFLGAKVVVIEKRESFTRNNVLHLWPFVIQDLRRLGAKVLYPKFCPGEINHISIRKLQLILLKVCLCLGVEVHHGVSFEDLLEPPEDQSEGIGWRAKLEPEDHPLSKFEFDVIIGADGRKNTLKGFEKKKAGRALAIAVTFNFVNYKTRKEAQVEEIGGIAYHFRQDFFKEMKANHGIDLENLVYYKDETHYFVVTAKKASLLGKAVLKEDKPNVSELLSASNVDHEKLKSFALEIAEFSTELPKYDYEVNHHGVADVALFDFTSVYQACHAACVRDRNQHKLLVGLVGDGLYQPFWPQGTGCGRGFTSALNAAWMIRDWALGEKDPLTILAERETLYLMLPMTPGNLSASHDSYGIDPRSRYKSMHGIVIVKEEEVKHLCNPEDHGEVKRTKREFEDPWESVIALKNMNRRGSQENLLSEESAVQTSGNEEVCQGTPNEENVNPEEEAVNGGLFSLEQTALKEKITESDEKLREGEYTRNWNSEDKLMMKKKMVAKKMQENADRSKDGEAPRDRDSESETLSQEEKPRAGTVQDDMNESGDGENVGNRTPESESEKMETAVMNGKLEKCNGVGDEVKDASSENESMIKEEEDKEEEAEEGEENKLKVMESDISSPDQGESSTDATVVQNIVENTENWKDVESKTSAVLTEAAGFDIEVLRDAVVDW